MVNVIVWMALLWSILCVPSSIVMVRLLRSNERPMDAEPQRAVGTLPDDKPKDPATARVIICQPNAEPARRASELVAA